MNNCIPDMLQNATVCSSVSDPDSFDMESKTTNYLALGLHNGFPSYRRSLQPSKENI
jgi:hypothetical protein